MKGQASIGRLATAGRRPRPRIDLVAVFAQGRLTSAPRREIDKLAPGASTFPHLRSRTGGSSREGPRVRIHLPPAESQSLGRIRVRGSRTPAFRAGVRGWFGDAVGRDAQGFPIRANLRQYLCRAIFQYRSAADVVGENATPIPTKSGLPRFNVRQIFEFGSGSGKAEHGALIVPSERQT
jgi:hypothetical protein